MPSTARPLAVALRDEVHALLAPLVDAAQRPQGVPLLMQALGRSDALAGRADLRAEITRLAALAEGLGGVGADALESLDGVTQVLGLCRDLFSALRGLEAVLSDPALAEQGRGLGVDLAEHLLALHLRLRHPTLFRAAGLLTLLTPAELAAPEPAVLAGTQVVRHARHRDHFHLDRIEALLNDPLATLRGHYLPNDLAEAPDAHEAARRLFPVLALLAQTLGLACFDDQVRAVRVPAPTTPPEANDGDHFTDADEDEDAAPPVDEVPEAIDLLPWLQAVLPRFVVSLPGQGVGGLAEPARVAVAALMSSAQHPGGLRGLVFSLLGQLDVTQTRGDWRLTLSSEGQVPAFVVGPGGVSAVPAATPLAAATARLTVARIAEDGAPALLLGSPQGTRLEVGALSVNTDLRVAATGSAVALALDARSAALVLAPADGDGFLASLLPAEGLRAAFELGLVCDSDKGFSLRGSAGMEATLPVGLSVAGVTLSSVHLGLRAADGRVAAEVSASLSAAIGPVRALVDRIGIEGDVTFPKTGGNLGVAQLDLGFKPPSGIGLTVEAHGVLTGGGFLFHDEAQALYAGVMQLSLHEQIALKAYGLIGTRMPDGTRGYSMLVFITAEGFRPIPLGLGFTLQAIGGMVAVHRSFDAEVLRAGLNNGSLATLLFPRDPVGNAPALISALAAAFPARRGSYLLGLMVRIGWATPTLVRFDLALILEFGSRRRLLVIGRISAMLPSADNDLIRLNLDAVGVLDFDQGTAAIDAVLVDSRLAHRFPITGAMALRARWGSGPGPGFVLAIGGLNPRFTPPAGLPPLARVAIALSSGDNPRLTCAAYFAITANTVQFGARAQLYAAAHGFAVVGDIGFDVLLELMPLHFIADFQASLQLKRGSRNLFKVSLKGELEGPRPLRVAGKASFEILWCDFSVRFDKTLVSGEAPPLPPAVDALAELKRALAAPTAWRTLAPRGQSHGVVLRKLAPGLGIVLDPLGRLAVQQQVLPLNTGRDIDRFGAAPLAGARRFKLGATTNGVAAKDVQPLRDAFSPAQFFDMSDDEKLAAPSFEDMEAGIQFGSEAIAFDAKQVVAAALDFEEIVVDDLHQPAPPATTLKLPPALLMRLIGSGAAARARVRQLGLARFRNDPETPPATLLPRRYAMVPLAEGEPTVATFTFSDSRARLKALNRAGARWQAVPVGELLP